MEPWGPGEGLAGRPGILPRCSCGRSGGARRAGGHGAAGSAPLLVQPHLWVIAALATGAAFRRCAGFPEAPSSVPWPCISRGRWDLLFDSPGRWPWAFTLCGALRSVGCGAWWWRERSVQSRRGAEQCASRAALLNLQGSAARFSVTQAAVSLTDWVNLIRLRSRSPYNILFHKPIKV